ncbi:hypothetical protein STEG23_007696, partial [Scotinomys teguina]
SYPQAVDASSKRSLNSCMNEYPNYIDDDLFCFFFFSQYEPVTPKADVGRSSLKRKIINAKKKELEMA